MKINKDSLKWLVSGRRKMSKKIKGFHSHWNTCVSPDSTFDEYVNIFEGSIVNSSRVGRFSKVISSSVSCSIVGSFVSIARGCNIGGGGDHPLDQISTNSLFYSPDKKQHPYLLLAKECKYKGDLKETVIGNDVWIGSSVIVKHGIKIGDGAVVAAGAVVVKDVPPYAVVGGVPAKVIKYRHTSELRAALIESQWWTWPEAALQVVSDCFDADTPLTIERFKEIKKKVAVFLE